jgi:hypothetical protein
MKRIALVAISFSFGMSMALAQESPRGPGGFPAGRHGQPPTPPIIKALDLNNNGIVETAEIENAAVALKTLDKNSDGRLSADELAPSEVGGPRQPHPTPPFGDKQHPKMPLMAALDTNNDGELSAAEIANTSKALKALDANGDGTLTMDELRPPPPHGFGDSAPPDVR